MRDTERRWERCWSRDSARLILGPALGYFPSNQTRITRSRL